MKSLVKYSIEIIEPYIFAVLIKDKYERGMTFCRFQEFYESPNRNFRGKGFSIWDYMDWYAKKNHRGFSYAADWSGYNIPVKSIIECYEAHWMDIRKPELFETPYDGVMSNIIADITQKVGPHECINGYILGTDDIKSDLFKHEICHAKYYTDPKYRRTVNRVSLKIKKALPQQYKVIKSNILGMGYAPRVVNDEIQAYMQYGFEDPRFRNNLEISIVKSLSKMYFEALKLI